MSVTRFTRDHNGVHYAGVESRDEMVVGSITKGDKKWTLKGFPKINRTIGSYKHGDEVQITIWNKAGTSSEKKRVIYADKWDTVEVFFSLEVWHNLIREYVKYCKETNNFDV